MATKLTSKIAVLGAGSVGSAVAFSLILNPVAGEILLVDPKEDMRDAQVQDLSDATYHGNTSSRIRAGTHKEAGQCDIVVITAGAKQREGTKSYQFCIDSVDMLQANHVPTFLDATRRFCIVPSRT